jgi:hypothetical protein
MVTGVPLGALPWRQLSGTDLGRDLLGHHGFTTTLSRSVSFTVAHSIVPPAVF